MSIQKVKNYLKKFNLDERVLEFEMSSATVELAAKALNCKMEEIAKSLTFMVEEKPIMIVCAGDVKVDNAKFKQQFNSKAKMLAFDEVEKLIGHSVGGVCPFAINEDVNVFLDESLKRFNYVYPACGSSNSAIKLTIKELEQTAKPISWIDVCKNIVP